MIAYLLQVTMCMAVFYTFYHFALRKETFFQWNRFYLLITLLLSVTLPLVRIYVHLLHSAALVAQAPVYVGTYLQHFGDEISVVPERHHFPWIKTVSVIYFTGVGVMTIRLLFSLRSIWLLRARSSIIVIENLYCAMASQVKSPFSFFNTIFLPGIQSFSVDELKDVICHENAHVKGKHSWDVIFLEITGILLWPSPLMYSYRNALKEIHEYIADAVVIRHTPWTTYSDFLIQQKTQAFQNNLPSYLQYSTLKNRLIMMAQEKSKVKSKWRYFGILPLLVILMTFVSCRGQNEGQQVVSQDSASGREKIDTISINTQLQYFMNGYSISKEQLASAIFTAANHNLQRNVILKSDRSNTVQDIADVFMVADKADARMIYLAAK